MTRSLYGDARVHDDARPLPPQPASIMLLAAALVGVGVTMIYSASAAVNRESVGWRLWADPGLRQLLFVPPALAVMWLASYLPYRMWKMLPGRRWPLGAPCLLGLLALGLLVWVLLFGPRINGAKRWIPLGPVNFQPSELAKLALVLLLAATLADRRFDARRLFGRLIPLAAICGAIVFLIIVEDFGTAVLVSAVVALLLLAGGARLIDLLLMVPPVAGVGFWVVYRSPARWGRITDWIHGGGDPASSGYQLKQSLLAIASGGWVGRGLGEGIQKLGYLPEDTTDFIFPIVCEELGLAGGFMVIAMFVLLLWMLKRTLSAAPDRLGQLIVLGAALVIGLQAAMNIAVVTGAIPAKGISLPFVSAGGSGLIIMSALLGVSANVARQARRQRPD